MRHDLTEYYRSQVPVERAEEETRNLRIWYADKVQEVANLTQKLAEFQAWRDEWVREQDSA